MHLLTGLRGNAMTLGVDDVTLKQSRAVGPDSTTQILEDGIEEWSWAEYSSITDLCGEIRPWAL